MNTPCPLCDYKTTSPYHRDRHREYLQCTRCRLVFVEPHFHLDATQEKAVYDMHQNIPEDERYRQFLNRLASPLLQRLPANSNGLDFGCGPGPTLSLMLEAERHSVALYDIFYANYPQRLYQRYDFITATEVVEHLATPGAVLHQLWQQLNPGGVMGLMTKLVMDPAAFADWHYKNDPTHISFFSRESFQWLAQQWQARLEFIGADVIILTKPASR